jgi:hypothetical protein
MYRTVFYLSIFVLIVSGMGLFLTRTPSPVMYLLPSGVAAWTSLLSTALLMHYALFAFLRKQPFKFAFTVVGALLLILAVIGIASPTYLGLFSYYVRPTNLLIVLISGVALLISGIEQPRESLGGKLVGTYTQYTQPKKSRPKQRAYSH